jgi:hypothetical protein
MIYQLYASVDELLAPETLTALTGQPVNYVRALPTSGGNSGANVVAVEANGGATSTRYILKRMSRQSDWTMLASDDRHCRSVALWQSGLLDRLQPGIDHAIIAGAFDGDGWALLMQDIAPTLLEPKEFTAAEVYRLLDGLATLHATFWETPELAAPALGLCDTQQMLRVFSPQAGHAFPSVSNPLRQWISEGWTALQELVAPDVVDVLNQLQADPQPLCTALARYPSTLVHGDYRRDNLGIVWQAAPQVVIIDWQLAGYGAATIDLAWFLCMPNLLLSPVSVGDATEFYRQRLAERLGARFDDRWWQPLLALGQLVNVLRTGCFKAWFIVHPVDEVLQATERSALGAYEQQVRTALQWL